MTDKKSQNPQDLPEQEDQKKSSTKVSPPKPKAPPPPNKGPKNTRGFGGTQVRRNAGRGR